MTDIEFQTKVIQKLEGLRKDIQSLKQGQERANSKLNSAHDKVRMLEDKDLQKIKYCPHTDTIESLEKHHLTEKVVKKFINKAIIKVSVIVTIAASIVGIIISII